MFRTANLVGVSRTTASRVYTNLGKTSSEKHNSGCKSKLKDRERRLLKMIGPKTQDYTAVDDVRNKYLQNHEYMETPLNGSHMLQTFMAE
ncbi:hypothetical protein TNCV_2222691 [Trichonephila clavipes]|nr:hypothetical protein TNCV_2222691 [Trichonephila clavipes]